MNLIEFKEKKYPNTPFVDIKKLKREFTEYQKAIKKYYFLKSQWKENSIEATLLKNKIFFN